METEGFCDVYQLHVRSTPGTQAMMPQWSYFNCSNMAYTLKQLAWKNLFVTLLIYLIFFNTSFAQPVPLPSGRFKCGSGMFNLTCERFGFDACIFDNNEFYCMPCNHEYLDTTCGTQDELPVCNLYCTEKAVKGEREILTSNFTKQLRNISKQANMSNEKNIFQTSRIETLQNNLRNKNIVIYFLIGALVFAVMITIIFTISCITTYCNKTQYDVENQMSESEKSEIKSLIEEDEYDNATEQHDTELDLQDNMKETDLSYNM